MIPFTVRGIVEQFRCSECDWAIILEEPFLYAESAQRVSAANRVELWYLAHDCSQFPKPAPNH
jgi:HJR/Mrr/RecB family endonuclease